MDQDDFEQDGFLGAAMGKTVAGLKARFKAWFDLAISTNRLGMRWLYQAVSSNIKTDQQFIAAILLIRTLQTYQSAILLIERGIISDARALIRVGAESVIALGAIQKDIGFVESMVADHHQQRKALANALLADPDVAPQLSAESRKTLEAVLDEVKGLYGAQGPSKVKWANVAIKVGMSNLYHLVYRGMSMDGVHTTATGLDRHLNVDPTGEMESLAFGPDTRSLEKTLSAAVCVVLYESRPRLIGQRSKWNLCSNHRRREAPQRRAEDEKASQESHSGIQGQGGIGCLEWR